MAFTTKICFSLAAAFWAVSAPAFADCEGDLEGAWERRAAYSADAFEPVEEFMLDSRTGYLEDCTREISYDARLTKQGRSFTFLYRARAHTLHPVGDGVFLSKANTQGQWEYRYRLIDRRG